MALPEHKYYTLNQAAKRVGCEVEDLIHFAAIGVLELCIKIPPYGFISDEDDIEDGEVSINPESFIYDENILKSDIEEHGGGMFFSYQSEYLTVTERKDFNTGLKTVNVIDGLLAIYSSDIEYVEFDILDNEHEVNVIQFKVPRAPVEEQTENYLCYGFYLSNHICIPKNQLLITKYELSLLLDGGRVIEADSRENNELAAGPQPKKQHANVERHAINREKLLRIAIFILSKYPAECRGERKEISPEKWRDCIVAHKNEIPPLIITNEEVILKHLRAAVNGKV
ncbi:hypothetical protein SIK62_18350 [Klebsiella sp. CN_Kp107]|uniref:hypothetical protein n=1 Tax=Klebsiella TaxID=570 RepID=UPI0029C2B0A8|nr:MULTISPECIES: hypothetical protein [Klebsiella]MDX6073985.1 hypothetical protein [Klebsiella sp. CN_Kp107]MEE2245448.1 hypothetical protein [Klebsiella pneumoniae]